MDCVLKSPPPCHRLLSLVFPPIRCRREREGGFQTSVFYLHINFFNLLTCLVVEQHPVLYQRSILIQNKSSQVALVVIGNTSSVKCHPQGESFKQLPPQKFGQPSFGMGFCCFALFIMQIESVFLCSSLPPSINDAIENTMIGPGSDKNERNKTTKSMITLL